MSRPQELQSQSSTPCTRRKGSRVGGFLTVFLLGKVQLTGRISLYRVVPAQGHDFHRQDSRRKWVRAPAATVTSQATLPPANTFIFSPLAPLVQKYVDEELSLKTQIPELRMNDDGILFGGKKGGADIFDSVRSKASSPPDVLVGPDSISVMSFTSGSEGRPKCVLGRHYSLAKYFPWMAERFNLSADSKFACLSGIAHDPIQRGNKTIYQCCEYSRFSLRLFLTQIFSRPCSSALSC